MKSMVIQYGTIRADASKAFWQPGPTVSTGQILQISLSSESGRWSVIPGQWCPAWGDGAPGGDRFAAPGVSQGCLLVKDGTGTVHPWIGPTPTHGDSGMSFSAVGTLSFIANDESAHDGYNGYLDNSGELQLNYQLWATVADDYPAPTSPVSF